MAQAPPVNFYQGRAVGILESPQKIPFLSEENKCWIQEQVKLRLRTFYNMDIIVSFQDIENFLHGVYLKRTGSWESMLNWTVDLLVSAVQNRQSGGNQGFTINPLHAHLTPFHKPYPHVSTTKVYRAKLSTM